MCDLYTLFASQQPQPTATSQAGAHCWSRLQRDQEAREKGIHKGLEQFLSYAFFSSASWFCCKQDQQ